MNENQQISPKSDGLLNQAKTSTKSFVLTVLLAVAVAFLIAEIALRILPPTALSVFKPGDYLLGNNLSLNHRIMKRNFDGDFHIGQGVFLDMDPDADIEAEPRDIHYKIDSYGFRNDHDYRPGDYILLGDSFLQGAYNDQSEILPAQLEAMGVPAYALAFPGDLSDYSKYLYNFWPRLKNSTVSLFFFEGNDFPEGELNPVNYSWPVEWGKKLGRVFKDFMVSKLILYNYYAFVNRNLNEPVVSCGVGGHKLGFDQRQDLDVVAREVYEGSASFERQFKDIAPKLDYVFFIPTKSRVYHDFLDEKSEGVLSKAQLEYLQKLAIANGLQVIDLTPYLIEEAKKLLPEGKYVWMKDDSHWNSHGISVAARVFKEKVVDEN